MMFQLGTMANLVYLQMRTILPYLVNLTIWLSLVTMTILILLLTTFLLFHPTQTQMLPHSYNIKRILTYLRTIFPRSTTLCTQCKTPIQGTPSHTRRGRQPTLQRESTRCCCLMGGGR